MKTYKTAMKSPQQRGWSWISTFQKLNLMMYLPFSSAKFGEIIRKTRKWTTWWNRANPGKTSEKTTLLSLTQPHETRTPQIQFYHLTPFFFGGGGLVLAFVFIFCLAPCYFLLFVLLLLLMLFFCSLFFSFCCFLQVRRKRKRRAWME